MMADGQEFCLRWNDFHSSFHVSLEALRGDESFTDVTLSCSGHLFKAHRVILSACSSHFKDILKEVPPQQHPVIVLPTVERDVMRAILEFIYQGQVNVRQARLGAFLQVAETFAIQGLADAETKRNAGKTPERPRAPDAVPTPTAKRRRLEQQQQQQPTVSGAGPPPPAPPPPPPPPPLRGTEKTVNLDLTVKPEPDSMLDELEEMLEPQSDQPLQDVSPLDSSQDAHGLMAVSNEDMGGSQANFKRRSRSLVWEYFERVTPIDARCLVCGRVFRQGVSGNTTNLRVHLRSHDVHVRPVTPRGLVPSAGALSRSSSSSSSSGVVGGGGSGADAGQARLSRPLIQLQTQDGTVLDIRQETLGPQEALRRTDGHGAGHKA